MVGQFRAGQALEAQFGVESESLLVPWVDVQMNAGRTCGCQPAHQVFHCLSSHTLSTCLRKKINVAVRRKTVEHRRIYIVRMMDSVACPVAAPPSGLVQRRGANSRT